VLMCVGEARFRVEQNFAVVASLLSLVMLRWLGLSNRFFTHTTSLYV